MERIENDAHCGEPLKLVINIKYEKPIELINLTVGLSSLISLYQFSTNNRNAKLFITEIRKSSIELHLIAEAVVGAVALAATTLSKVNDIIKFCQHFKAFVLSLTGRETEAITILHKYQLPSFEEKNYQDMKNMLGILQGKADEMSMSAQNMNNKVVFQGCHFYGSDAAQMLRAIQEKRPQPEIHTYKKQLFQWVQTNFKNPTTGNRGAIENIYRQPLKVIFEDESLRHQMTSSQDETEWQKKYYIVDVEVQYAGDKPKVYKIINNYVEDSFPIEEEQNEELCV